jgi:hypothetical protein
MTWIENLVSQHSELESPIAFWFWSGLSAISATVKDNVWLNRQFYNLYPNIYVMLHAKSGLKKSSPVSAAKQLVTAVNNTNIISGRASIQGILKKLGTAQTRPGGIVSVKSTAFICSSELTSSLVEDPAVTKILTDLYDRNINVGDWESLLKMENFNLKNPTVTMLTATNEAMGEDFFSRKEIQGGYIARTFIIYESKRNRINSLLRPLKNPPDYVKLAEYLKELSKLKGEFLPLASDKESEYYDYHIKDDMGIDYYYSRAGKIYETWYTEFINAMDVQEIEDETGTLNRFGDSVLKVALLISLSREPKLEIDEQSMIEAIEVCEKLVGNIRKTTMGKHKEEKSMGNLKGIIIEEVMKRENHQITQKMLLKKYWMYFNMNTLTEIMDAFDHSGMIVTKSIGNTVIYEMPPDEFEKMKRYLSGKDSRGK